jgi:hypothetical protein
MAEEKRKRGSGPVEYRNYGLSEQARKTIKAHAAEWDLPESVILDHLACTHLRAVKIVAWSKAPREDPPADDSAEARDPAGTLPIGETLHACPALEGAPAPEQGRAHPRAKRTAV